MLKTVVELRVTSHCNHRDASTSWSPIAHGWGVNLDMPPLWSTEWTEYSEFADSNGENGDSPWLIYVSDAG